jgi:hypothetical protein
MLIKNNKQNNLFKTIAAVQQNDLIAAGSRD